MEHPRVRRLAGCLTAAVCLGSAAVGAAAAGDAAKSSAAAVDLGVLSRDGGNWTLALPADGPVVFHGSISFDQAGSGPGHMLYPAPGPVGFIAALVTHGVLVESTKQRQKTEIQTRADAVLAPYQAVLATLTHRDLIDRSQASSSVARALQRVDTGKGAPGRWRLESLPVFSMTQDQSAIVLDNLVALYRPDGEADAAPAYRTLIRVVSSPKDTAEPALWWTADEGVKLKEEAASLFAMSLDLMMRPIASVGDWKTVRYLEGRGEKIERARIVEEGCDRRLLMNLRQWLMSVPTRRRAGVEGVDTSCVAPAASPPEPAPDIALDTR